MCSFPKLVHMWTSSASSKISDDRCFWIFRFNINCYLSKKISLDENYIPIIIRKCTILQEIEVLRIKRQWLAKCHNAFWHTLTHNRLIIHSKKIIVESFRRRKFSTWSTWGPQVNLFLYSQILSLLLVKISYISIN